MADSREEKIIKSMLGEQVELEPPQSRIEVLLYELKDAIEQGGGGGGSVEPFFFKMEIKGLDPQSGEPIIETTSASYNDVQTYISQGRPIFIKLIMPEEMAVEMNEAIEQVLTFKYLSHSWDREEGSSEITHIYSIWFDGQYPMECRAFSPTEDFRFN